MHEYALDRIRYLQATCKQTQLLLSRHTYSVVHSRYHGKQLFAFKHDNDPSAGSHTDTLLRLLLPLNDIV